MTKQEMLEDTEHSDRNMMIITIFLTIILFLIFRPKFCVV